VDEDVLAICPQRQLIRIVGRALVSGAVNIIADEAMWV